VVINFEVVLARQPVTGILGRDILSQRGLDRRKRTQRCIKAKGNVSGATSNNFARSATDHMR
jgi:hypothetical protein